MNAILKAHDAATIDMRTRAKKLADGALVDLSKWAASPGFKKPLAVTAAVWEDCCAWTEEDTRRKGGFGMSADDRADDLAWMAWFALRSMPRGSKATSVVVKLNCVPRAGRGRMTRLVRLSMVSELGDNGEPVLTIMKPGEA